MSHNVLQRFVILMAVATVGIFVFWEVLDDLVNRPPGDYHTEVGMLRLEDGLHDEAMESFDAALEQAPEHRGALMGRALVFIDLEQYDEALAELDYLIDYLSRTLEPGDATGLGALAAAHANKGIVLDRLGRYEEALASYVDALNTDRGTVSGPGIVHKILYATGKVSTVRERAQYIFEQLQLPEEKRLMRVPELDARQRAYKP
jgi:tetratricopeptide (TPR) repeat protein